MIRVVDIETTGMAPPAEVIEIGWADLRDGRIGNFGSRVWSSERPSPPEVRAVHHIDPRETEPCPRFSIPLALEEMGPVAEVGCAHNAEFERSFIGTMFDRWICTYKCALVLWPAAPSHGNQALMYWLGLDEEMDTWMRQPAHRALPDAYVTAHILRRMVRESGWTVDEMVSISMLPRQLPNCPIGKFRGRPWSEVDTGFLSWMLRQPDMERDYVYLARTELDRRRTAALAGDGPRTVG